MEKTKEYYTVRDADHFDAGALGGWETLEKAREALVDEGAYNDRLYIVKVVETAVVESTTIRSTATRDL